MLSTYLLFSLCKLTDTHTPNLEMLSHLKISIILDACPCNGDITVTDFRGILNITLQPAGGPPPIWQFRNDGKEIFQEVNSAAGIAIGDAKLSAVEFEGTMYVGPGDDDWIGAIFSFQDSSNFYLIMGAQKDRTAEAGGPVPWQLKRVKN